MVSVIYWLRWIALSIGQSRSGDLPLHCRGLKILLHPTEETIIYLEIIYLYCQRETWHDDSRILFTLEFDGVWFDCQFPLCEAHLKFVFFPIWFQVFPGYNTYILSYETSHSIIGSNGSVAWAFQEFQNHLCQLWRLINDLIEVTAVWLSKLFIFTNRLIWWLFFNCIQW